MNKLTLSLASCIALLGACVSSPEPEPADGNWISIETESGPFCGRCDTTKLVIREYGLVHIEQGHWLFNYRFWQTRRRSAQITQENVAALRAHLEPFRPEGTLDLRFSEECDSYRTHMGGAHVRWYETEGEDVLYADFGCESEQYPVTRCDMIEAIKLLSIENLRLREWDSADCG